MHITSGHDVVLDRDYLDHGWVDHAYAVTIHKAQGVTCDRVLVVGPAGLYREGAYVALSRARHSAQLYATTQQATDVEQHRHGIRLPTEAEPDPEQELIDRLNVTAAKNLVTVDDPQAHARRRARRDDEHSAAPRARPVRPPRRDELRNGRPRRRSPRLRGRRRHP